jgi:hypothetical protein
MQNGRVGDQELFDIHNYREGDSSLATSGQPTEEQLMYVARDGWPADKAFALMHSVWEPDPVWSAFISQHTRKNSS